MVGLDMPAAPNPIIKPMLVTIAEAAPKLTVGSLKVTICAPILHGRRACPSRKSQPSQRQLGSRLYNKSVPSLTI